MSTPRISIILATYNDGPFLATAINSILEQTFGDFELLVMNDGSTDESAKTLANYASRDSRIRLFENKVNVGLVSSLNVLLDNAHGEFIARMDGDDISEPRRLEHQIAYMKVNEVDVCGTWTRTFGRTRSRISRYPRTDAEIRATMLFETPFSHPTMVFRRDLFDQGLRYRDHAPHAEDYDLFARLPKDCRLANVPEVLLQYRTHPAQVSVKRAIDQQQIAGRVRQEYVLRLGVPATQEELAIHMLARSRRAPATPKEVNDIEGWLLKLAGFFSTQPDYLQIIGKQWFLLAARSAACGFRAWKRYVNSPLHSLYHPSNSQKAQLFSLCLARISYRSPLYNILEQFSG